MEEDQPIRDRFGAVEGQLLPHRMQKTSTYTTTDILGTEGAEERDNVDSSS